MTEFATMFVRNLVTPKVAAKLELNLNKPAGLLNISSCSAAALGVAKFITIIGAYVRLRCLSIRPVVC